MPNETKKLDSGQKHMLRLIVKGTDSDGWAPVSAAIFPVLDNTMPRGLIELEPVGDDGKGRVRLTRDGQNLIDAMTYL